MENSIHVLYLSDRNYAAFAGTSMVSLFENNRGADSITVWFIDDNLGDDARAKLMEAAEKYGRAVRFLDMSAGIRRLQEIGAPRYRNSYTTYLKLFAFGMLPEEVSRVLFIDSDTVVTGDLSPMHTFDMQGNAVAAVKDVLCHDYMVSLGFPTEDSWYNMGVMLVDTAAWRLQDCEARIVENMKKSCAYVSVDQDLLNITLHGQITKMPPCFNATPHHFVYRHRDVMKYFPWADFYSEAEIAAAQKAPLIRHFERFLGQSPWHRRSLHPFVADFDKYLALSPWNGYEKKPAARSFVFGVERLLYRLLPSGWFLAIFSHFYKKYFKDTAESLRAGRIDNINV